MKTEQITDGLDVGKIQRILNEMAGRDPDAPPPPVTLDSLADQIADVDRRLIDVQWAINELVGMIQRLALK